ncbi:MAG: hypothetical protein GX369_01045 [Euryarchaeota archaeon]|nr:hypothetical protein [Euryarchaeota archaeon]
MEGIQDGSVPSPHNIFEQFLDNNEAQCGDVLIYSSVVISISLSITLLKGKYDRGDARRCNLVG